MKKIIISTVIASTLALSGCANLATNAQTQPSVIYGKVLAVRDVEVKPSSGIGAIGGAGLGGFLGSRFGGGNGKIFTGILGAIGGGVAGNAVEKQVRATKGTELVIAIDNQGHNMTVTQTANDKTNEKFFVGEYVKVIGDDGKNVRVTAVK